MKKTILTSILAVCMLASQAQETNPVDSYKPIAGDRQFSFGLFNNSSFFALKKYKTPKRATRFGLSGYYLAESSHNESSNPNYYHSYPEPYYSISNQESNINASYLQLNAFFGVQRSLGDYKNFEPYVGIDFSIGNTIQNRKTTSRTANNYTSSVYMVESTNAYKSYLNPSVSVLPLIGFNYYLAERFALGAEYRLSIFSVTYNAKSKSETSYHYSDGYTFKDSSNGYRSVRANGAFSGSAYITATLYINGSKK